MTPVVNASELITSWTLGQDGHTLTCALVRKPSGTYVLRLRHEGRPILDEPCQNPQQAISRSLEVFHVGVLRGWLPARGRSE